MSEPVLGDAFGGLLLAAYQAEGRPGEVFEVVERDDGHVRVNDASRYFLPSWGPLDDWVYQRVQREIVDVGCGAGRNALALQAQGHRVLALDVSAGAIEVCRHRGVRDLAVGTVEVLPEARFDTFLLLGNNIGLLGGREQARSFLTRLAASAAGPGACILGTAVGREPGSSSDPTDQAYERRNIERGRLPWQVTMRSRFRDLATEWFDYTFLRVDDLEGLTAGTSWRVVDHHTDGGAYAVRLELSP